MLRRERHAFQNLNQMSSGHPAGQRQLQGRDSFPTKEPECRDEEGEDDEYRRGLLEEITHG